MQVFETGGDSSEARRVQRDDCNNVPAIVPGVDGANEPSVVTGPASARPAAR